MLEKSQNLEKPSAEDYRLGIQAFKIFGRTFYGHSGLWDTYVLYNPKEKHSIAINFTDGGSDFLLKRTIRQLEY